VAIVDRVSRLLTGDTSATDDWLAAKRLLTRVALTGDNRTTDVGGWLLGVLVEDL